MRLHYNNLKSMSYTLYLIEVHKLDIRYARYGQKLDYICYLNLKAHIYLHDIYIIYDKNIGV